MTKRPGICLVILAALSVTPAASCAPERVTFERYLGLSDKEKTDLEARYVTKEGSYYKVDLGTYLVRTDVDAAYALRTAALMDDFYMRFSSIFIGSFKINSKPLLYVLGTSPSYQKALSDFGVGSAGWSSGMYVYAGAKRALFADRSHGEAAVMDILFHEGTHQLLHSYTGGVVPVWFGEGTATNFESWEVTRTAENNVANSLHASSRASWVAKLHTEKKLVPLSTLVGIDSQAWMASKNPLENYASAWVVVNYLLSTNAGQKVFSQILATLRSGKDLSRLLPDPVIKDLESRVETYAEEVIVPHFRHALPAITLGKKGDLPKALVAAQAMVQACPKSDEAQFLVNLFSVLAGDKDKKYLKALQDLDKKNFQHPEMEYAIAQVASMVGEENTARDYAKKMLKKNSVHAGAKALLETTKD